MIPQIDRQRASGLEMNRGELVLPVYVDETDRRQSRKANVVIRLDFRGDPLTLRIEYAPGLEALMKELTVR